MSLELEQAIEAAKGNDLQEAILKLCEAMRRVENDVSYLQAEIIGLDELKELYEKSQERKGRKPGLHKKVRKEVS